MEIFWTLSTEIDENRLLHPGRSQSPGSAAAWSLLTYVLRERFQNAIPEAALTAQGKPWFPSAPGIQFSLSHTKGAVLAAVSSAPVGADIERHRAVRETTANRLMQSPHGDLELFELWTLRESWYKLTGQGSLLSIPFSRNNGVITAPETAFCRIYHEIPDYTAAACSLEEPPPETMIWIDPDFLYR